MKERDYILCTQLAHVRDAEHALHGLIDYGSVSEAMLSDVRGQLREIRLLWEVAVEEEMGSGEPKGVGE